SLTLLFIHTSTSSYLSLFQHLLHESENELKEDKSTVESLGILLNELKTNQSNTCETNSASPTSSLHSTK
ncbi:hypothetical protein L9F63_023052, partial [Diploptera punctata]